jgi:hypothetical protein
MEQNIQANSFTTSLTSLTMARILLIVGFLLGLISLSQTVGHINDPNYLVPTAPTGATHAWYHFLREAGGDVATMVTALLILFAPLNQRNSTLWWVLIILLLGYYAPFWVGIPVNVALSAPSIEAEIVHLLMATFSFSGAFLARRHFVKKE